MSLHPDHQWALALGLIVTLAAIALLVVLWPEVKPRLVTVLEFVTCKKDYEAAVALYLGAADLDHPEEVATDPVSRLDRRTKAGSGIKAYFKDLWMAFILVDALLIASSMTPFSQAATQAATARDGNSTAAMMPTMAGCIPGETENWRCAYSHVTFGVFWSVTLGLNVLGISISMLLLGYMLAVPDSIMHVYADKAAKQGFLGYPATLTLLGTVSFMLSVSYSAFIYYGLVACIAILAIFVGVTIAAAAGACAFNFTETPQDLNEVVSVPLDNSAYAPGYQRAATTSLSSSGPFGLLAAAPMESGGSRSQSSSTSLTPARTADPYAGSGERPLHVPMRTVSNTLHNRAASRELNSLSAGQQGAGGPSGQ